MNKITLQEIINKKLNICTTSPDELITDAYMAISESGMSPFDTEKQVVAYIDAQVAIQANKACGITIPNIEMSAMRIKKESGMDEQDMADFYMEHLDK